MQKPKAFQMLIGRQCIALVLCCFLSLAVAASDIANDEELQFFATVGSFNEEEQRWHLPIHGWIYEPASSWFRKAVFAQSLKTAFDLDVEDEAEENFDERISLLIADNERNKRIVIEIGEQAFPLAASAPNGHFIDTIQLSEQQVQALGEDGFIHYRTVARDGREFVGSVQLLEATGVSVISDIDDTIKITEVLDRRELLNNTFLKDFVAVPGMAQSYRELAQYGTSFHYVSSSPWQLYPDLWELLQREDFPWATLSLKNIRFRDRSFFALFQPGTETKPPQIRSLITAFPLRDFILVGDSGEADPEVYAEIMGEFPERVHHVFIRNITAETLDNERFQPLVDDAARWTLFSDPAAIHLPPSMAPVLSLESAAAVPN